MRLFPTHSDSVRRLWRDGGVAVAVPETVGITPVQPPATSVNSALRVCCQVAVAVTMPHIQFRHTQSISENPALLRRATCSVNVV